MHRLQICERHHPTLGGAVPAERCYDGVRHANADDLDDGSPAGLELSQLPALGRHWLTQVVFPLTSKREHRSGRRPSPNDAAGIVRRAPLAQPGHLARQRARQTQAIGGLDQQRRADVPDRRITSVRRHCQRHLTSIALHPQGDHS